MKDLFAKIDDGTITVEDINVLLEATPESIRDRVRRRTNKTKPEPGEHNFQGQVAPKRKPDNSQKNGRGKLGHRHSTRTQRRNANIPERFEPAFSFIIENMGKPIGELDVSKVGNVDLFRQLSVNIMNMDEVNSSWLADVLEVL